MCFEIPAKIISKKGKKAKVGCRGNEKEVDLVFLDDVRKGDYVLIRGNLAVSKIEKEEIDDVFDLLKSKKEEK